MTLRTLNYGNYGIFLIMGNAGFCPSTVGLQAVRFNLGPWEPDQETSGLYWGSTYGSFRQLGIPYFGVLIMRILLLRVLY